MFIVVIVFVSAPELVAAAKISPRVKSSCAIQSLGWVAIKVVQIFNLKRLSWLIRLNILANKQNMQFL